MAPDYNDNMMIFIENLAAIGSGTRWFKKAKWAQMKLKAEHFLHIFIFF